MSYMGGQHLVSTMRAHYCKDMVENGVWLTCQKCGVSKKLDVPHQTSDEKIVGKFKKLGWKCTVTGYKAKCPKCA